MDRVVSHDACREWAIARTRNDCEPQAEARAPRAVMGETAEYPILSGELRWHQIAVNSG